MGAAVLGLAVLAGGCSSIRGIPSHGGGKRFDEEERIVSGSIRRSVADMDLKELRGHTVMLMVESISHNGGGYMTFPGLTNLSANWARINTESQMKYARIPITYTPFMDYLSFNDGHNYGASASYSPNPSFSSAVMGTDADLNYLRAVLTMKAQHSGLVVVPASPEYVLYVLVDVLGLNRNRRDSFVYWVDHLVSSCELTYYALDAKTNQLTFPARQAAAQGGYTEYSLAGFTAYRIERDLASTPHSPMPVDGEEPEPDSKPTTQKMKGKVKSKPKGKSKSAQEEPAIKIDQTMKELLDSQLNTAKVQMEASNFPQAEALLNAIRAVDPQYPGLAEADNRLQYLKQSKKP